MHADLSAIERIDSFDEFHNYSSALDNERISLQRVIKNVTSACVYRPVWVVIDWMLWYLHFKLTLGSSVHL